ncbi:unnamed protein product [Linum trigynum]|uniref:Uncharacterized protein n=1 Tax=Linum trigynum TaxID=586398 RepID=A0AAV2C8D7_9ROSI
MMLYLIVRSTFSKMSLDHHLVVAVWCSFYKGIARKKSRILCNMWILQVMFVILMPSLLWQWCCNNSHAR